MGASGSGWGRDGDAVSPPRVADCTGVLLAGGRARRMGGAPKGLLLLDGQAIVERALALFRELFGGTLLVANDPGPYVHLGVPVVSDLLPGRGAPGGLHTALATVKTGWAFLAACDMPHLSRGGIELLAARRAPGAGAVVAEWGGRLEPLHGLWSRSSLPAIGRLLAEGEPSMRALARAVSARIVPESEWRAVDPGGLAFSNANTPGDLERLGLAFPR